MGQLQALALAISTDGINYFAQEVVAPAIIKGIASIAPASKTINPSSVTLSDGPVVGGGTYWDTAENIAIKLSGGTLDGFTPAYQRVSQVASGVFNLYFNAGSFTVNYAWNESYKDVQMYVPPGMGQTTYTTLSTPSNTYDYSLNISSLSILVPLKLATTTSGGYSLQVQTVVATPGSASPNIPSGSVILKNSNYLSCFKSRLSSATQQSLENVDFATPIETDVKPLFGTIPDSGKLLSTPSATIVYDYGVGTSPLSFPGNQGLTIGVTGQVTYNTASFSSATVPSVPVPAIPSSSHLAFNLADYEFNALFWAFYEAGTLATTVIGGDLPDPSALNTSTYAGTYLHALYSAYASAAMTVVVTADAAPTLAFQQVYCLTSAAFTALADEGVPSSILTTSFQNAMKGAVYLSQSAFNTKVELHGGSGVSSYITNIDQAAQTNGALATHDVNCQFNVIPGTTAIPVFTVQFNETDFLSNLQLGIHQPTSTSPTLNQTVKFDFQLIKSLTSAKLVSSNLSGINSGDFGEIWNITLQPVYAQQMAKMGAAGVPLPFIQGFQFLFASAVVAVQSHYVDVVTNVEYTG